MLATETEPGMANDKVLLVDDEAMDRKAIVRAFRQSHQPYDFIEQASCAEARDFVESGETVDVALVDYQLSDGTGMELVELFRGIGVPTVLVTGAGSESVAMKAIHKGVFDYVIKDSASNYLESLPIIVRNVVGRFRAERQKDQLVKELRAALEKVQTLRGLIPICADCKSIRNDRGFWENLETFITNHSMAEFSHGICPECLKKYEAELDRA